MTTPLELATTAATGIVGAMATKAWSRIRELCVVLLRRHLDEESGALEVTRLDERRKALVDTSADSRAPLTGLFEQETMRVLHTVLERSPEAADTLRSILKEARSTTASGESVVSDIRIKDVKTEGDFMVSGHTVKKVER